MRLTFLTPALVAASLSATALMADGCPTAPDLSVLDSLYAELRVAPDEMTAREITNQMWQVWDDAPDEPSQQMLTAGMRARSGYDFLGALGHFDKLVSYCPFYAEGYNQRAFVNYLRGDYAAALPDLEQALELNPRHIGALSGQALSLLALGREQEGQAALRKALEINPWLTERHLLKEPPGQEL
ncbi:MAG: tetratricopeptide repeat protein [Pelagimonas sp.]|jgi:tetratricopeptide (TPR) repeat protein|nr:tetratricopeptide repeat protein [Pelagimonas sp.]